MVMFRPRSNECNSTTVTHKLKKGRKRLYKEPLLCSGRTRLQNLLAKFSRRACLPNWLAVFLQSVLLQSMLAESAAEHACGALLQLVAAAMWLNFSAWRHHAEIVNHGLMPTAYGNLRVQTLRAKFASRILCPFLTSSFEAAGSKIGLGIFYVPLQQQRYHELRHCDQEHAFKIVFFDPGAIGRRRRGSNPTYPSRVSVNE